MGMSLADFFSRTDSTMLRDAQVVDVSAHKEKREIKWEKIAKEWQQINESNEGGTQ